MYFENGFEKSLNSDLHVGTPTISSYGKALGQDNFFDICI